MKYEFTDDNKFKCYFDYSLKGDIKSYGEEVKEHFKKITNNSDSVYLLFSGGMDSKFIALILLELKINFTAITYGFKKDFTDYDSRVSKEFARKHGFNHEIIYVDIDEVSEVISKYHNKGFFSCTLNSYYILLMLDRYYKTGRIFLTGQSSEFKIINDGVKPPYVKLPYNFLLVQKEFPCIYNFMTERIFFAYFNEKIIKDNLRNKSLDMWGARNKLYNQIYPENLKITRKTPPDDQHLNNYFHKIACKKYEIHYKNLRKDFFIDLETHYNKWENT